jgi:hypothetical protein
MSIKTYSELIRLPTFEDRFEYLKLKGSVGKDTFGHDRYLNQVFYSSMEWRRLRDEIIIRDNGCDLGIEGREIGGKVYIHHLNPLGANDILTHSEYLVNPEYLICVSFETHNAIHYGDINLLPRDPIERKRNDTCPWRR